MGQPALFYTSWILLDCDEVLLQQVRGDQSFPARHLPRSSQVCCDRGLSLSSSPALPHSLHLPLLALSWSWMTVGQWTLWGSTGCHLESKCWSHLDSSWRRSSQYKLLDNYISHGKSRVDVHWVTWWSYLTVKTNSSCSSFYCLGRWGITPVQEYQI